MSHPDPAGETRADRAAVSTRPGGWSQDRLARATLCQLAEPGDPVLGHWLHEKGPVELLQTLLEGVQLPRMSAQRARRIHARLPNLDPVADLERCAALGGRFICPGDLEWPSQLDDLADARPIGLWVRGTPSLRAWALRSVAMVGARACTDYGRHVAGEMAAELTERGWVVVSGAAYGIDAAGHRGALAARGATVAALACGVDVAYPRRHQNLLEQIAAQGLLLAELPPGSTPNRERFVLRNRVIAALTRGVVVVEAGYRSGALITARRSRELGRHVMAVPGSLYSPLSGGCHQLVRDGAELVTEAGEVAEQVGAIGGDLAVPRWGDTLARDLLSPAAARAWDALPTEGDVPAEAVSRETGDTVADVLRGLHELAVLGFAEPMGKNWRLRAAISASPLREGR